MTATSPLTALPWPGGKSAAAPRQLNAWIHDLLPKAPNVCYIEPFAGMCGLLLARKQSWIEIVNDTNQALVNWWLTVREQPQALGRRMAHTPSSRMLYGRAARACTAHALHYRDKDIPDDGDLEWAADWMTAITQRVGSLPPLVGDPGLSWKRTLMPDRPTAGPRISTRVEMISQLGNRMIDVQIECKDAVDLLRDVADKSYTVIYADPPYPGVNGYYGAVVDQAALDEALLAQRGRVAVSGYPGDRQRLEDAGWDRHTFSTYQSMAGRLGEVERPRRQECLWTNYEPSVQGSLL